MKFIFKAKSKQGELKEGFIDASSSEVALEILQKNDLYPISIKAERQRDAVTKTFFKYFDRVNEKELMVFFRQLTVLIEARVPIVASLNALKEQTSNKYFQKVIEEMVGDIQDGMAFSQSMQKHGDLFSNLAINMIKSGEVSGNLRKSVSYVADNIEKNYNLASKVRSALLYPIIVLVVFFVIAFLVITFVVPRLMLIIKDLGTDIPWYTKGLIYLSDFMSSYWWVMLIIIFGIIGGFWYYVKTEDGRREWDQIKIKLPIFGKVFRGVYIARFADNLSVLLQGGIPIIKALTVVSAVVGNSVYQAIFLQAADEVKTGGTMSEAFKKYSLVPPVVSQMVKIGEESGQVDAVLNQIAKFYEQETDETTKNLSTLIEPLLMVVIGVAVGILAFSVIMPIYNIAGQM